MKVIFFSFFMFVGFLQAQTVVENFTQKTPLVVLPDILVKRDTIFYSNNNLNKNEKNLFEQFFRQFKDNINIKKKFYVVLFYKKTIQPPVFHLLKILLTKEFIMKLLELSQE